MEKINLKKERKAMQPSFNKLLLILLAIFVSSCNKNEFINPSKNEFVQFMGESVHFPESITAYDIDKYLAKTASIANTKSLKVESKVDWDLIPLEERYKLIKKAMLNYPDLLKLEYNDQEIKKIHEAFSAINNNDDVKSKKSILFDYYNILVIKDLEKSASNFIKKGKISKVNINSCEWNEAIADPIGANYIKDAADAADFYTRSIFGPNIDGNDGVNAFRHCFWNALGVRVLCLASYNKWRSLNRMKKFANAHECYGQSIYNAMDLNNNLAGRTYMYETVGQTWLGTANNIPSVETIINAIIRFNTNSKTNISDIFAMSPNYYNWYNLGDINNGYDYHTPTKNQLVVIP